VDADREGTAALRPQHKPTAGAGAWAAP